MRHVSIVVFGLRVAIGCGALVSDETVEPRKNPDGSSVQTFKIEVWSDNWFALYLGDTLLLEDSVPITAERSFNAETHTFEAEYPLQLNLIAKDFKENDTGLEYIGTRRQQMGDGGIIAQITDVNTGKVVAVTNRNWKAPVIHKAPLDAGCAGSSSPVAGVGPCGFESQPEPEKWKSTNFSDKAWVSATEHSVRAVRPKDGYGRIKWDAPARIIWGPDLEKDNTILLRYTVTAP